MIKEKLVTKSVYLPEKIVERIEINKEGNDSFSSCITRFLKYGIDAKLNETKKPPCAEYFAKITAKFEAELRDLKNLVLSQNIEGAIDEKFEKFRDGLNKISKHIISTDDSIKSIKNQINDQKNMR
jgi:hypothetical protein